LVCTLALFLAFYPYFEKIKAGSGNHFGVCVCVCVSLLIIARPQLGKYIPAAMSTHATLKELLDMSFSVQRKVGD
jgi:hypothetical protein